MSPVRKPRRSYRDEEAGLTFSWRIPGGSLTRTVIAVLLTAGLFAGAASIFEVKRKTERFGNREAARVMALFPDDPGSRELLDHAKQHSPFPDRWNPDVNEALKEQVALLTAELEDVTGASVLAAHIAIERQGVEETFVRVVVAYAILGGGRHEDGDGNLSGMTPDVRAGAWDLHV